MKLLDLYCGAGGASVGYERAGFDVVGIDIKPQPRYPFEFYQTDALLTDLDWIRRERFDVIHASPPCQRYTALRTREDLSGYPDLIAPTRELLEATGLPYVIENVEGSPLRPSLVLCAASVELRA